MLNGSFSHSQTIIYALAKVVALLTPSPNNYPPPKIPIQLTQIFLLKNKTLWLLYCRFYSDNANENNEYRAAGFTIELRDTGQYGFQLPPDQVRPIDQTLSRVLHPQSVLSFTDYSQWRGDSAGCACIC